MTTPVMPAETCPLLPLHCADTVIAWQGTRAITHREFLAQANALAATLQQSFPHAQQVINVCENPYTFVLSFAAAILAGHTNLLAPNRLAATLNKIARSHEHSYLLSDAADHDEAFNALHNELIVPVQRVSPDMADLPRDIPFNPPRIAADFPAAVLFTSGSTGESQAWVKPWGTLVHGAAINAQASLADLRHATVLGTVPVQHSYGLETLVMLPLQGHCAVYCERPFFPQDIATTLSRMPQPRVLVTTPVHLRAMQAAEVQWPALASIWSATAPLPASLATQCEQHFDTHLHEIFGCTEVGTFATRATTRDDQWQLLDAFALTPTRDDTGQTLYWIHADHVPVSVCLQDEVQMSSARRFQLLGRGADMINIAGKRASLADLNHILLGIAGVRDGIFLLPDDPQHSAAAQRTAAIVVSDLPVSDIMNALRTRIDAAFLPRPLLKVPALPRNDTGKLPRAAVLALFEQVQRDAH